MCGTCLHDLLLCGIMMIIKTCYKFMNFDIIQSSNFSFDHECLSGGNCFSQFLKKIIVFLCVNKWYYTLTGFKNYFTNNSILVRKTRRLANSSTIFSIKR